MELYLRPGGAVNRRNERRLVEHRIKEGDYFIKKRILEDVKFMRSRKEIRAIEKQIEDAAVERARREVEAKFLKSAETAPVAQKQDIPA